MTDNLLLIIALIMFLIGMITARYFNLRWLYALSGLLWFLPIVMIENIFIVIFSSVMIIACALIGFYDNERE